MMNFLHCTTIVLAASLISACSKEPLPPTSVAEFKADPILLEATMVRCAHDRSKTKYDAECVNAREAGNLLAASDRDARRKELDAQSARKRHALRRTQEAAAEARRYAAEMQRQREEDEYLGVFEAVPGDGSAIAELADGVVNTQPSQRADLLPGNQPGAAVLPQVMAAPAATSTDIDSVREELKRRQESSD
jgi:hypothetical protein